MKIIGIVGILDFPKSEDRVWKRIREAFEKDFDKAEFVVEHALYLPWQKRRIRAFAVSIVEKHDKGENLILVGYSLGGIIATAIAGRFVKSHIQIVVTIGAPHKIKMFYKILGSVDNTTRVPLVSFCGVFDPIVPWFLTRHPTAVRHVQLFSDHLIWFIASSYPATQIAKVTKSLVH